MPRPSPTPVPVSIAEAEAAYPVLCAYVAERLRSANIPALRVLDALDELEPEAGSLLCGFEQNYEDSLGDDLDNMWRVLSAYAEVMEASTARGVASTDPDDGRCRVANAVYPWMAKRCEEILTSAAAANVMDFCP